MPELKVVFLIYVFPGCIYIEDNDVCTNILIQDGMASPPLKSLKSVALLFQQHLAGWSRFARMDFGWPSSVCEDDKNNSYGSESPHVFQILDCCD